MSSSPVPNDRGRPTKRRRIARGRGIDHATSSPPSSPSYLIVERDHARHDRESAEKENEKPNAKYKIHIPQDDEVPQDVFFTQPPPRSNSPYRIEDFHWRKPEKSVPDPGLHLPAPRISHDSVSKSSKAKETTVPLRAAVQQAIDADDVIPDGDSTYDFSDEDCLADLPEQQASAEPDANMNSFERSISSNPRTDVLPATRDRPSNNSSNLKQTTLFGTQVTPRNSTQTQAKRNWPMANREEPPTHHELDRKAMERWIYPVNLGAIRDYQYTITATGLFHNTLVALPTGLGKTFIAATIMLNWYRWTKSAQIVFVAPTKPLVAQQVKACFGIAGIPKSKTSMLTGSCAPGLRAEEWQSKRVFFMTPQTLINDLKTGICDPKRLVLIVVDEAHRATGSYAYVEVVKFVKRFNESFRVLALTATPGGKIENVQAVIDGLTISRVEIRTEDSLDIRQFVYARKVETKLFDNSPEMEMILDLFAKALQPAVDKLTGLNAYWSKDPLSLTPFGCTKARERWMLSDVGKNAHPGLKNMVITSFGLLASLSHATELLKYHGIGPFYQKVLNFRNELHAGGKKGGKEANAINTSSHFQTMMSRIQVWINSSDFIGHPKLEFVQRVVMNHFLDAGEGRSDVDPSSTRIMIFAHFRQSAEELVRILKRNDPMIRPHVFVGQSASKDSEAMDQKTQLSIIQRFQSGIYNTLVATSIGEEGLDIGEVDLIICYDASASPVRMLQRMGRTGRKRAGNIILTLMRGKEENSFLKAKDNYEKMQQEIASGARFAFHEETVRRIVPKEIQPVVDKCVIEIPIENTQAELPEPTKRARPPKRPPKKFHMPDNVQTGFRKASRLQDDSDDVDEIVEIRKERDVSCVPVPALDEVTLTTTQQETFEQDYLEISGDVTETVNAPHLDRFPRLQSSQRPVRHIRHGKSTLRMVKALSSRDTLFSIQALDKDDKKDIDAHNSKRISFFSQPSHPPIGRTSSEISTAGSDIDPIRDDVSFVSVEDGKDLLKSVPRDLQGDTNVSSETDDVNDSDDDLPDLATMVELPHWKDVQGAGGRRRARNTIVEDESDD